MFIHLEVTNPAATAVASPEPSTRPLLACGMMLSVVILEFFRYVETVRLSAATNPKSPICLTKCYHCPATVKVLSTYHVEVSCAPDVVRSWRSLLFLGMLRIKARGWILTSARTRCGRYILATGSIISQSINLPINRTTHQTISSDPMNGAGAGKDRGEFPGEDAATTLPHRARGSKRAEQHRG